MAETMKEDRNKWVRDIDQPVWKKLTAAMNTNATEEQRYIMDSFAELFSYEPGAKFANNIANYFTDAN